MRSRQININVDLDRVRFSAETIRRRTRTRVVGVIKADAYGLGAARVADAIRGVVDELAYFSIHEAREVGIPGLVMGPPEADAAEYRELSLRPVIGRMEDAPRFAQLPCVVSVDTGMQRFGCAPDDLDALLAACRVEEIHTHASSVPAVAAFERIARGWGRPLLAACTSLLDEPAAWLDGVRPGLALYRGAMRVSTRLMGVRDTHGPVGYTGFRAPRVGIILAGYSNRLAPATVLVNGRRQRLLEIGMNSSYVSVDAADRDGDEVVLLGDGLTEAEVARDLGVREHEVLCRYGEMGQRAYAAVESVRTSHDSGAALTRG